MVGELPLLRVIVVYLVKELAVIVGPFLKGILFSEYSRSDIPCYHRRLNGYSARAAHGVIEVALSLPSRHHDHSGCQHLVERSLYLLLSVAATVQGVAAGVKRYGGVLIVYVDIQPYVRVAHRDCGTLARALSELIDYRVLYLVGHEARIAERLAIHYRINGKCLILTDILTPVYLFDCIIHLFCRCCREALDWLQYAYGGAQ